jgi:catechol 2,3-dioxygenase-like lactoylglutathione lyase family enzyme
MQLAPAIPVLRIFDKAKARTFYVEYLGFTLVGKHRYALDLPLYAVQSRGPLRFHLSELHNDATPDSAIMLPVSNAEALLADLHSRAHPRMNPDIEKLQCGHQVAVADPFENRLLFLESKTGK